MSDKEVNSIDNVVETEDKTASSEKKPNVKKPKPAKNHNWMITATIVLASSILTLLCLIPFGYIFSQKIPNPIGVVDLQKLVDENQSVIMGAFINSPEISEQQRMLAHQQAQQFANKLSKAVENTAKECKCVLINKAAVLTEKQNGVLVDYTDKIRQEVKK